MSATGAEAQKKYKDMKDYFRKMLSKRQFSKPDSKKGDSIVKRIGNFFGRKKWNNMMKTKNSYDKQLQKGLRTDKDSDWKEVSKKFNK